MFNYFPSDISDLLNCFHLSFKLGNDAFNFTENFSIFHVKAAEAFKISNIHPRCQ